MNTFMRYLEIVSMQQDMVDTSLLSLQECCKHSNESAYDSDGDVIHQHIGGAEHVNVDFNFNVRVAEMSFARLHMFISETLSDGLASLVDIVDLQTSDVELVACKNEMDSKIGQKTFPINEMTWPEIMRMVLMIRCLEELGESVDFIMIFGRNNYLIAFTISLLLFKRRGKRFQAL